MLRHAARRFSSQVSTGTKSPRVEIDAATKIWIKEQGISEEQYILIIEREHRYLEQQARKKTWDSVRGMK